ncbi:MAG: serine/threonine protein phosphatase PrpC [Cycloclasticus pugetii]|mgnify:CR=1 FL=1|jgi:serine/threonine protein phosphatase PrpC|uniref:bifunctional protein-serine/threonine kinase/phosphatase n=1 Tax=Cycloclasticus pugetii TaxID=34068 RepID=UPI00090F2BC6|nr:bifunctional protein-serine/threonine kinase/phosphatase [Cycloclasticus pugetii]SHJ05402.1 serine/threonine protein kinase [Cycloclasticus pugetii]|tara:strand:+ start:3270 stop:4973 length:1704 start_codon:yes stop_codon:yes gene_type:complete
MQSESIIDLGQSSDKGLKTDNEDSYGVLLPESPVLEQKGVAAVIADGVSGCDAGKLASESCVKSLLGDYYCTPDTWTVKTSVQKVLTATNRWMLGMAQQGGANQKGLATTMSALVVKSSTVHLFHIGDTRIYRIRDKQLELLTDDHRFWVSKEKNYLTRAIGIDLHLEIDYSHFLLEEGDTFLFTTDGVHEFVSDNIMLAQVNNNTDNFDRAARNITDLAMKNGSHDNVTCQIVRFNQRPHVNEQEIYRKLTELPFPPDLSAGMTLDGYRIERELHASNRTQVYLATDIQTQQQVVIKTPSVNYVDDPTFLDMFVQEEWIGRRIDNNHVLKIIEQTRTRRFLYYVTEYIEGQTLRHWMSDNPQPSLHDVRGIVRQIARGLRAFHKKEMIHQDLKPENIIIDTQGTVKIIDFGSTKVAGVEEIASPIQRLNLLGTQHYTAPEYLLGQPASYRSDAFSLGVITYEMLTGKLPFGEKYGEKALSKLHYIPILEIDTDIPLWIDGAIRKIVNKKPSNRYEEISEFIHDLSHPNKLFTTAVHTPLVERNPLAFWKAVALLSLFTNAALLLIK